MRHAGGKATLQHPGQPLYRIQDEELHIKPEGRVMRSRRQQGHAQTSPECIDLTQGDSD